MKFFLKTCLDQVRFMEQLVQPDRMRGRILCARHAIVISHSTGS